MSKIVEIKNAVIKFLKENGGCKDITVIKLEKSDEVWDAVAEAYEDDSFLKSMNLPPKMKRVFYSVKMDDRKEVFAFERMDTALA
ncbi:MAG: hypothetical protein WCO93_07240 [bacterium]